MRIGLLKEKDNSIFRVEIDLGKAMKEYSRDMGSTHLTSEVDGDEWYLSEPSRFTTGKKHRYPLNRRLGGPQSRSEPFGEKYLFRTGIFSVENENIYYRYISSAHNPANINKSEKN